MSITFQQLIEKAKDEDKEKIKDVMELTLEKTQKDTITPDDIKIVKAALDKNSNAKAKAANAWEADSIVRWKDKYKTFLTTYKNDDGGKRRRKKKKSKKKKTNKKKSKKKKGGRRKRTRRRSRRRSRRRRFG